MILLQELYAVRLDGPIPRGVEINMERLIARRAQEPQVSPATENVHLRRTEEAERRAAAAARAEAERRAAAAARAEAERRAAAAARAEAERRAAAFARAEAEAERRAAAAARAEEAERRAAAVARAEAEAERRAAAAARAEAERGAAAAARAEAERRAAAAARAEAERRAAAAARAEAAERRAAAARAEAAERERAALAVITFNEEVQERIIQLHQAPLTKGAVDTYNQLTQNLAHAINRPFSPRGQGWPEARASATVNAELERLRACTAQLDHATAGLREDLQSVQTIAAEIEGDEIGLRESHLNISAYEHLLEELQTYSANTQITLRVREMLTKHSVHPPFVDLPHDEVILNPKNYNEDFTSDEQCREVIAFVQHQLAFTTFKYLPQEVYFALAEFYILPHKDRESEAARVARSRETSSREKWIDAFEKLEHLRIKVDGDTVISGSILLMIALNNLTSEQLQTFFENLAAENFLSECPKVQLKFILDGMKVIIGNMERYASSQDQAQEQLFDYLQRYAGPAGVSFAVIGTILDDTLTDLKDFIDQYPDDKGRLITDAQYRRLETKNITKEELEAVMRNCFEYTRDLFRQKLIDEGSALSRFVDTTWEAVKQQYRYDFSKILPPPPGFISDTAALLDQLSISNRDPNFAPHITKAEMTAAMRAAGDSPEGISMIVAPISTKFYNRLRYLQQKRPAVAVYTPQKCYDTLIRWIRAYVDLEGEDKRHPHTARRQLKEQAGLPGVLELSRNNMLCILEEQRSRVGGEKVWDPAGAAGADTLSCFGNVWLMRWGKRSNENRSWGIDVATFPQNSTLSMAEIITYLDQRIQNRGEGVKDEIFAFLYAILLDGNGFCENGKLLRAIRQMAELPEFRYDTGAQFIADNR